MQKIKTLLTSLSISVILTSCTTTNPPIFQIPTITVPPPVVLPLVKSSVENGKMCFDLDNARLLYTREQLLKQDNNQLRSMIEGINEEFGIDE